MMVIPATKDLSEITTSLIVLMKAVNGSCTAIDLLLPQSIIYADGVRAMFRHRLHIFFKTNGNEDLDHMADVFIIRVPKHVEEIREFSFDKNVPLHALGNWHGRSMRAIKRLKGQSRRDCNLSMKGCKRVKGETGKGHISSSQRQKASIRKRKIPPTNYRETLPQSLQSYPPINPS